MNAKTLVQKRESPMACWVQRTGVAAVLIASCVSVMRAEDWPEFRGANRRGIWRESGIVERFPADGVKIRWRTPIRAGFAGPAVSNGRIFVVDYLETARLRGLERAVALDEQTGRILWTQEWPVTYAGMLYAYGPKATPTVDGDRVYVQGADGKLLCLATASGAVVWKIDYATDLGTDINAWAYHYGFASAPIVDGDRVIAMVGATAARVIAFDKRTGKEVWRALPSDADLGVGQPVIISAGGVRQLILWFPDAVVSLDPATGRRYWEQPFKAGGSMTAATPIQEGDLLFVTNFYNGGLMLQLDSARPAASVLWKGTSDSEIQTEGLHATTATPVMIDGVIYGICSYGQFRALVNRTGERLWETQKVIVEKSRWASAQIVRHGDRLFINNDRGELIIMVPDRQGYREISRTTLIKPTSAPGNRRQLGAVLWSHPAYANRHIIVRNDEEIISASLAAE